MLQRTNFVSLDAWIRLFAVDLLFVFVVVLICYMVITPILPEVPIFMDLPISCKAVRSPGVEGDIMVSVLGDGETLVLGNRLDLAEHLHARRSIVEGEMPAVRVRVDPAAPFGAVRRVVRVAQGAGYRQVTFVMRVEESNGFILDFSADCHVAACAGRFAVAFFSAAILWTVLRRRQSSRPGFVVWMLLLSTALCLAAAWEAYSFAGWRC